MKNYEDFKKLVEFIIYELQNEKIEVTAKKWAEKSPYQKRRYKEQFVYPEVWLYRKDSKRGMVITGDGLQEIYEQGGLLGTKEYIKLALF